MRAAQQREVAANCLTYALKGNFKKAAHIRQQAYASDPPGTIGVDWNDWRTIWNFDSRYLHYLQSEDFSDMDTSQKYIESFKAALFVDNLFGFRDFWAIKQIRESSSENFQSSSLESFLNAKNWVFHCEVREYIYARTKAHNISARIYNSNINHHNATHMEPAYIYSPGEYDLGFAPGTPEHIIEERRRFLSDIDLFQTMSKYPIEKFPKTFQTFEKHKLTNSEKYQEWMRQYSKLNRKGG